MTTGVASTQSPWISTSNLQTNWTHTRAQMLLVLTPVAASNYSPQMLLAGRHHRGRKHRLAAEVFWERSTNLSGARHERKTGNLFLQMDIKSLGSACWSNMWKCECYIACGEAYFSYSLKNYINENRIRQLCRVGVSRALTRRKVKWRTSPASIFSSLAVPYKVTQANECLFQLLVLDY